MADNDNKIILSQYTKALIEVMKEIKPKSRPDDISALSVSQTVSFFALAYEKVRNAIEYRDDHLILRAAIERILKRRLALNPEGKGEAENLIRELLWARYFDNTSLGGEDIIRIQNLVEKYLLLKQTLVIGRPLEIQGQINQFLFDILTCEVEESLKPASAQKQSNLTSFIFQVLRKKIKIEGLSEEQKDSFFLYSKSRINPSRCFLFSFKDVMIIFELSLTLLYLSMLKTLLNVSSLTSLSSSKICFISSCGV